MEEKAANNPSSLTFEERLRNKSRSGFDTIKNNKEEVLLRKEQADKLKNKKDGIKYGKKMPKQRYSKLPVSIIRPLNLESNTKSSTSGRRDPRFDSLSGQLNEGLFKESYSFIKEVRDERIGQLKELINQSKKEKKGDPNAHNITTKLREMLGEEKDLMHKSL